MAERLLADLIVVIHGVYVLFAVFGGLIALKRQRWAWLHIPAFLWAGMIELAGGICPLTPLENMLRTLAGEPAYRGGFIDHYLMPVLYPDSLTRGCQVFLGCIVLAPNVAIYAALWLRNRRRPGRHPAGRRS